MSDLWMIASGDAENERDTRMATSIRVKASAYWSVLASAESPDDFSNRLALVGDRLDEIVASVTGDDPMLFIQQRGDLHDFFIQNYVASKTASGEQCEVCGKPATKYVGGQDGYSASGHHVCDAHADRYPKTASEDLTNADLQQLADGGNELAEAMLKVRQDSGRGDDGSTNPWGLPEGRVELWNEQGEDGDPDDDPPYIDIEGSLRRQADDRPVTEIYDEALYEALDKGMSMEEAELFAENRVNRTASKTAGEYGDTRPHQQDWQDTRKKIMDQADKCRYCKSKRTRSGKSDDLCGTHRDTMRNSYATHPASENYWTSSKTAIVAIGDVGTYHDEDGWSQWDGKQVKVVGEDNGDGKVGIALLGDDGVELAPGNGIWVSPHTVLSHDDVDSMRSLMLSSFRVKADYVDDVMSYESGEMSEEDEIAFFQKLIDDGTAWQLQGHYGRTAQGLIDAGLCHPAATTASRHTAGDWETGADNWETNEVILVTQNDEPLYHVTNQASTPAEIESIVRSSTEFASLEDDFDYDAVDWQAVYDYLHADDDTDPYVASKTAADTHKFVEDPNWGDESSCMTCGKPKGDPIHSDSADATTASKVATFKTAEYMQVWSALSPENQSLLDSLDPVRAEEVVARLIQK